MAARLVVAKALVCTTIAANQPGKLLHQPGLRNGASVAAYVNAAARIFYCVTAFGTFPRALSRHPGTDIAARLLQLGVADCCGSNNPLKPIALQLSLNPTIP